VVFTPIRIQAAQQVEPLWFEAEQIHLHSRVWVNRSRVLIHPQARRVVDCCLCTVLECCRCQFPIAAIFGKEANWCLSSRHE
jgi:hypothetical protein